MIAPEIDDGSVIYLLAKPVPRLRIVISKLVVAVGATVAFAAVPILLAGLRHDRFRMLATRSRSAWRRSWAGPHTVALFLLLGVVSRHAVVIGLVYVFLLESLGIAVSGVGLVSVQQWAMSVADAIAAPGVPDAHVALPVALALLVGVTIAATWYAGRRLRAFSLTGEE